MSTDNGLPVVGCRMPTFGRPELLNEAVESFLRQDYPGPKKLYILNDLPGSTYCIDHDEVTIENSSDRFPTLGDKFNHLIGSMECDIVVNWSDDDIRLPWAISTIVEKLADRDVFTGVGFWYMESGEIQKFDPLHCAGVLAYRYHVWSELNGYAPMNSGEDWEFYNRISARFPLRHSNLDYQNAYFIYRWNTGFGHLSAHADPESGYRQHGVEAEKRVAKGMVEIRPFWAKDYVQAVRKFREGLTAPSPQNRGDS